MANEYSTILVTGSAGFLGAPLAYNLLDMGIKIIGIDNYSNSNLKTTTTLKRIFNSQYQFYELDLASNLNKLDDIFKVHKPSIVIHLAALKSVQESIKNKNLYENNNIKSTENLLSSMIKNKCKKMIFSSSAAVYGNQVSQPINEEAPLRPESVYAETKVFCEQLINDACKKKYIDALSLRYFNPIGSHPSKLFKACLEKDEGSIMQEIIKVALKKNDTLYIFGNNYHTDDGTCERDFIHIDDILDAHIKSIKYINLFSGYDVFNVGTGSPISILRLVKSFIAENKIPIRYEFANKKQGDIKTSYADVAKINNVMKWNAKKNLSEMVIDEWAAYYEDLNKKP